MTSGADHKQAAIEQWTADPCESPYATGEPGTRPYFESILRARGEYGPWFDEALGYAETAGMDVLDVGCGQGIDVCRYALAGARATGVDLTPRHVELARAHLRAMGLAGEVVEGDAEALPFPDASFDRVSSNGVLHHTPDMPAALREVRRILRPGGEARIVVYNRASFHYWLDQVLLNGVLYRGLLRERSMEGVMSRTVEFSSSGARPLVRVYSPRAMRRLMLAAGFGDVHAYVRHLRAADTFVTRFLERHGIGLTARTLDRLGRVGGWYVVAVGSRW